MRIIFGLFFGIVLGMGLEIQVNFGKENNQDFSVLNLNASTPFECKENYSVYGDVTSVVCQIDKTPINNFVPTDTVFFNLATKVEDNHFYFLITPKFKAKLFSTFIDLKNPTPIPKERPKKSKHWQIVGYIDRIPFLSEEQTSGLNFPINIPSVDNLYIKQLDINLRPLKYEEGLDFDKLKEIRILFAQQKYADVLNDSSKALRIFPSSIFRKDFMFYKIKALSHFPTKDNLNTIITLALEWIKAYPSDKSIPEVLYILANTYAQIFLNDEAYYYYKRIINEYGDTNWMALAKMQLAKNFASEGLYKITPNYFVDAYRSAKNKQTADQIAVEWALFSLEHDEKEKAKELLDLILKSNPAYLLENSQQSISVAKALAGYELYDSAASIGSYLIDHLNPNDERLEDLIDNVAQWYQSAGMLDKARAYNLEFLSRYPNSKEYKSVVLRNDRLLFDIEDHDKPEDKIKAMDEIIKKYPNTKEAQTAYQIKAQALFDLEKYQDVLNLEAHIPNSPLLAKSKNALILEMLKNNQCKKIPPYLKGSNAIEFGSEAKLDLFDCLYSIGHYKEGKEILDSVSLENKSAEEKLPWTYRLTKVLYELGDYTQSRLAGDDTSNIAHALKLTEYYDVDFYLFHDLAELKLFEKAQKLSALLNENFKDDARMLKVWRILMDWAKSKGDANAVEVYTKDILALQPKVKNYDDTPYVNLVLIETLNKAGRFKESKEVINSLLKGNLTPADRQKILYIQGSLLKALGEDAKDSFKECAEIDILSNWRDLCQKSLGL